MTDADTPRGPDVREQRLVFGEDTELHEKARAGYPESLVVDVLALVGFEASQVRALEVGAGGHRGWELRFGAPAPLSGGSLASIGASAADAGGTDPPNRSLRQC